MDKKILIDIQGIISKIDSSEISEKEHEDVIEAILIKIDEMGFCFAGGTALLTEKEQDEQ